MKYIDEKFKDSSPEQTVERIVALLAQVGLTLTERWHDSGIDDCWSVTVSVEGCAPFFSNGKGVTRELARASAYAEFIERLQCGLLLYKFQSLSRDPEMDLHRYAPDARYMTMAELEQEGDWMDHVIDCYGGGLTRKRLAQICKTYACTTEDKILTLPFYSLFEDKYVYLPAGVVSCVYATNGCCAGNTREEAWVHALAEMMERRSAQSQLMSGKAMPPIPEETLRQFPTAMKILDSIRQNGKYDIQVFDLSLGNGFPVVATRIINKKTQDYVVNIAADPVLEIAIDRTLTEIFQGKNIDTFSSGHGGNILKDISEVPYVHNTLNQMENGNGLFTADFFAEELSCDRPCTRFEDHRYKNNKELLEYMLGLYRQLGRPVYVRNYSFLGFCSYHFVVPGFSETRGQLLTEPVAEYALGDEAAKVLRDPTAATIPALAFLQTYYKKIRSMINRRNNFPGLAGLPMSPVKTRTLLYTALSYTAWRLGQWDEAVSYLDMVVAGGSQVSGYFACVRQYLKLRAKGIGEDKIRVILGKFFESVHVEALYQRLERGGTPYDGHLLRCDGVSCQTCAHRSLCSYPEVREYLARAGQRYRTFTEGQSRAHFLI